MAVIARCLVVLLLFVASCAASGSITHGRRAVSVSMQVQCRSAQPELPSVPLGEPLHNGDFINLLLRADGVAHVYLLHGGAGAPPQLLIPSAGAMPPQTQPQESLRLPASGSLIVEGSPGGEQLVAVISLQPLDTAELFRRYYTPQEDPPSFRPSSGEAMRCGGMRCIEEPVVRTDATGVAVLRYRFRHE